MEPVEELKQESSQRRERTKNLLIEAALTVFAEHGVAGASIEMISEEAGFTRGAFYSNFESKEELFFDVVDLQMTQAVTLLGEGLAVLVDEFQDAQRDSAGEIEFTPEVISSLISRIVPPQFTEENWFVILSEYRLLALRDSAVNERLQTAESLFNQRLTEVLVQALDTLGLEFTIDAELATEIFVMVYQKAVTRAIGGGSSGAVSKRGGEATSLERNVMAEARDNAMRALPQLVNALIGPRQPK